MKAKERKEWGTEPRKIKIAGRRKRTERVRCAEKK